MHGIAGVERILWLSVEIKVQFYVLTQRKLVLYVTILSECLTALSEYFNQNFTN